jgi:hypothetical protein
LAFLTRFTHVTTGKDREPLVFTQNTEKHTSTTGNHLATQPLHPAEQCPFTSSIRNQGQLNFFSDNNFRSFSQSPGMLWLGPRKNQSGKPLFSMFQTIPIIFRKSRFFTLFASRFQECDRSEFQPTSLPLNNFFLF